MAGKVNKAAALLKNGRAKAKSGGTKLHSLATDPEMQAKTKKLFEDGKRMYLAATSPEAKQAYRHVALIIKKARKK